MRKMKRLVAIIVTPVLLFAAASSQPDVPRAQAAQSPPAMLGTSTYRLGPEDQVSIWVLGVEEISPQKPISLDPQGYIDLPFISRVSLAGLTTEEAAAELKRRYAEYVRDPQVTVTLIELRSQPVSVMGAVNTPGILQLKGHKTLLEILSMAGGLRADAGYAIKITRKRESGVIPLPNATIDPTGGFSVAEIRTDNLIDAAQPAENIRILPHDVITVPRADLFYVIGEVRKSGGFVLGEKESVSVLQALSMAEGLSPAASGAHAKVLRRTGTSGRTEIAVNVKRILSGRDEDVMIQADDVLFIPTNTGKKVSIRALETAISLGTGVLIWRR